MTKFDKLMGLMDAWNAAGRGTWNFQFTQLANYAYECLPSQKYAFYFGLSNRDELRLSIRCLDYLQRPWHVDAILTAAGATVLPHPLTGKVNRRFIKTLETLYDQV